MSEATTMDAKQEQKSKMPKWMHRTFDAVWGQVVELGEGISQISSDSSKLFMRACEGIVHAPVGLLNWTKEIPDRRSEKRKAVTTTKAIEIIKDIEYPKRTALRDKAVLFQIMMRQAGYKINLETCREMMVAVMPELKPVKKKAPAKKTVAKKVAPKRAAAVKKTAVKKTASAGE